MKLHTTARMLVVHTHKTREPWTTLQNWFTNSSIKAAMFKIRKEENRD